MPWISPLFYGNILTVYNVFFAVAIGLWYRVDLAFVSIWNNDKGKRTNWVLGLIWSFLWKHRQQQRFLGGGHPVSRTKRISNSYTCIMADFQRRLFMKLHHTSALMIREDRRLWHWSNEGVSEKSSSGCWLKCISCSPRLKATSRQPTVVGTIKNLGSITLTFPI